MDAITIARATADDYETIRQLCLGLYLEHPFTKDRPTPAFDQWDAAIAACLDQGVVLLATRVQAPAVGILALYRCTHPITGADVAEELAWWVAPEHRNGQAGLSLLRAGVAWATTSGVSYLRMAAPFESRVGTILRRLKFTPVETAFVKRF